MYFSQVAKGAGPGEAYQSSPTLAHSSLSSSLSSPSSSTAHRIDITQDIKDHLIVNSLIRSYQVSNELGYKVLHIYVQCIKSFYVHTFYEMDKDYKLENGTYVSIGKWYVSIIHNCCVLRYGLTSEGCPR